MAAVDSAVPGANVAVVEEAWQRIAVAEPRFDADVKEGTANAMLESAETEHSSRVLGLSSRQEHPTSRHMRTSAVATRFRRVVAEQSRQDEAAAEELADMR